MHAVHLGQCALRFTRTANRSDHIPCEKRAWVLLSTGKAAANGAERNAAVVMFCAALRNIRTPALLHHVSRVVRLRPQEEMLRIRAWRVIAMVAHTHPLRDLSVVNHPRDAMRQ